MHNIIKRYLYIFFLILSFLLIDIILRINTNNGMYSIFNFLFDISWISLLLSLILILKGIYRRITYSTFMSFFVIIFITQSMFHKFFGSMFSFDKIGLTEGGGSKYIFEVLGAIPTITIVTTVIVIILIIITNKLMPKDVNYTDKRLSILLLLFGLFARIVTINAMGPLMDESDYKSLYNERNIYNDYINTNEAYSISGLYEYTFKDFYITYIKHNHCNKNEMKNEVSTYLKNKGSHEDNKYTNIFKGKNLILIQMESIDSFLVTKDTMPTLYNMMMTGINFKNHYSPRFGGGDTFNTEFTVNTGLLPPIKGGHITYTYVDNVYPYALPNLFKENGYTTDSYHFNTSEFYKRGILHKAFGYTKYNSLLEMGINDEEAQKDSIFATNDKVYNSIVKDGKYMSFIITYSAHTPYSKSNYLCSSLLKGEIKDNEEIECLQAQAHETDNMLKLLIDRLKKDNKLDNTVFVLEADHYAFGIYDTNTLYKIKGTSDVNMLSNTPFIIWNSKLTHEDVDKINGSIDVVPTVANMFGLTNDYSNYIGNDIFDNSYNGMTYFSDFSWYDGTNYFKDNKLVKGNANEIEINRVNKDVYEKMNINEDILITNYFKK